MLKWAFAFLHSTTAGLGLYSVITKPADDMYNVYSSIVVGCQVMQLYVLFKYYMLQGIFMVAIMFQAISTMGAWKLYNFDASSFNQVLVSMCVCTGASYVGAIVEQALFPNSDYSTNTLYQPFVRENEQRLFPDSDYPTNTLYQPFVSENVTLTIQCSICLEDVQQSEDAEGVKLSCEHVFHKRCIDGWLAPGMNRWASCPNCRTSLNYVVVDE